MFVLDTNVVSEFRKVRAGKAAPGVADWASEMPSGQLFVSSITIHELEHGVLLAERVDPPKGALLRRWLDDSVAAAFDQRVLAVDTTVLRRAATLHVPDTGPFRDAPIGATALVHRMTLLTRNVKDFNRFDGLDIIDPWQPQRSTIGLTADVARGARRARRSGGRGAPMELAGSARAPHWHHNRAREDAGTCRRWLDFAVVQLWCEFRRRNSDSL